MRNKRLQVMLVTMLPLCVASIMFIASTHPSGLSLFGAGHDFSVGSLVGFVSGIGIGLALFLRRTCKPAG